MVNENSISIQVYVESGKKRTFAGGLDWPGWCRSGKNEELALDALLEYGSRYAQVLTTSGVEFRAPGSVDAFIINERLKGNVSTDFGAPAVAPKIDQMPMNQQDFERSQRILKSCWVAFDRAVQQAIGKELRKGPRGGGRDLKKIQKHVLEADQAYLKRLARKFKINEAELPGEFSRIREEVLSALEAAARGEIPELRPRGGKIWTPRYFVRRVAWHVLDHAWEIEDRIK